jgi:hypothetical protein
MVAWPWSKPPLPPPPPPHFIEAHASFVGVLLCIAGPLSCYLLLGPPLKARAPSKQHGRATMTTIDWPRLSVAAAQQSREVFVGCVALFLALRTVLRIATGHTRTAGAVTSGEQVVGDAASLAADVMAYNIVSLAFACSSSALGVFEWLGPIHKVGGTALDRLYGRSPLAERLCRLTAGYECFNLIAVVLLPEYRTAAFIGHHAVTCFLGVLPGAHIRPPP